MVAIRVKFIKVKMHNFISFGDEEFNLDGLGYAVVTGKNNNKSDNASSNGSGKSSIFNAICYALTGETTQGVSNNIENIYTNPEDCWVELKFLVDDSEFVIKRIKSPRPDMRIFVDGIDMSGKGIRESTKLLQNYLPDLTSQVVGSIIILGQGLPYRFTNNNPSQRKELLEKLTKSDFMIQSIREKLDVRQTELKSSLRQNEDSLIAINTQLELQDKRLKECEEELKDYDKYNSSEGGFDLQLSLIKSNINKCLGLVGRLSIDKSTIESSLSNLEKSRDEHIAKRTTLFNTEELTNINSTLETVKGFITDDIVEIKSLEKEIARLEAITDICPTCGQRIPNVHKIDTTELHSKLDSAKERNSMHNDKVNDLNSRYSSITNALLQEFTDTLNSLTSNCDEHRKNLKDVESKIYSNNNEYQSLLKEELRITNLRDNYNKLIDAISNTSSEVSSLTDKKKEYESCITTINEHLTVVNNMINLAKREFRGILLENVIKYMNTVVMHYSKEVFGSSLVSFILNENYIDIMFNGKYYETLSGGEKQKVDIIVQFVLRDLLSNQLDFHSNIMVIDECLDGLDQEGCQNVIDLIQNNATDATSIFIISHRLSALNISYDTEVEVSKSASGVSKITIK